MGLTLNPGITENGAANIFGEHECEAALFEHNFAEMGLAFSAIRSASDAAAGRSVTKRCGIVKGAGLRQPLNSS